MEDITIITLDDLKADSTISSSVDAKSVEPFIHTSQVFHIKPILGDALYNQIIDQISGSTLSGANYTLVHKYITPTLNFYTLYEAVPFIWMRIEAKGVLLKFSDYSQAATDKQINYFRQVVLDKANNYKNIMIDYLVDNVSSYPLWRTDGNATKSNSSGIFLG